MKMHVGVDAGTGYIHTITATAANVHDVDQAASLIREDDTAVYGDAGYLGMEKRRNFSVSPVNLNGHFMSSFPSRRTAQFIKRL